MFTRIIRWSVVAGVVATVVLAWGAENASAQGYRRGEYRRYTPARPTFGDAFDYARDDVGLLTEYHTFVRPHRQLRGTLERQDQLIRTQEGEIESLRDELTTAQTQAAGTPTGKGGGYLNYSHYYNLGRARTRR